MKVVVIAGSHDQFQDWCMDNNLNPRTGAVFINRPFSLRGLQADRVQWVGIPIHWTDEQVAEAVAISRMVARVGPNPTIDGPKWAEAVDTADHVAKRLQAQAAAARQ